MFRTKPCFVGTLDKRDGKFWKNVSLVSREKPANEARRARYRSQNKRVLRWYLRSRRLRNLLIGIVYGRSRARTRQIADRDRLRMKRTEGNPVNFFSIYILSAGARAQFSTCSKDRYPFENKKISKLRTFASLVRNEMEIILFSTIEA